MNRTTAIALCAMALYACGGSAARQPGATLEGLVQGPTRNLTVDVPATSFATTVDSAGHFALLGLPAGASALHFAGPGVDATLHMSALSSREHREISVSVSARDATEHEEESEDELRGSIDSIAAPSFALGGRKVVTTTATAFRKGDAAIAFADLTVGESVEAEGVLQQDGSLLARSVKVEDETEKDDADAEVRFAGLLSASAAGKLTVGGIVVVTGAGTRIEKADQAIAASALAVGDRLRVEGTLQADKSVLAKEIRVLSPADEAQALIAGSISAIAAASHTFTVGNTVIGVDAATRFSGSGPLASLADLRVGDLVDVEAARQADGSLLALQVERLGVPDLNEVEVKGAIEQLTASSLQVQGKTFSVDASTDVRSSGNPVKFSSLTLGQVVEVRGTAAADGSLHATRISVESGH